MPYFKWVGVDIVGKKKSGKVVAYSQQELSQRLFSRGIALLWCKQIYVLSFFWPVSRRVKNEIFTHIAQLLRAGMLFPNVLRIVAQRSNNPFVCDMLSELSIDISHRMPFVTALEKQKKLCNPIAVTLLEAGNESANMVSAAEGVAYYYEMQDKFKKDIRSALAMPLLTLLFFFVTSFLVFVFIIPRFADMFASLNQKLPSFTLCMIAISSFMRSWAMIVLSGMCVGCVFGFYYFFKTIGKSLGDRIVLGIPFVGNLIYHHQLGQVLYALSLLVLSGVSLAPALHLLSASLDNSVIKRQFEILYHDVISGCLLSDAMDRSLMFLPEIAALVRIGEESGLLGESLESASALYADTLRQSMQTFVFFLQPLMIVLLGVLITALIFAVYLPIMDLSYVI
jgi:type IV pilus assembly protein PilC